MQYEMNYLPYSEETKVISPKSGTADNPTPLWCEYPAASTLATQPSNDSPSSTSHLSTVHTSYNLLTATTSTDLPLFEQKHEEFFRAAVKLETKSEEQQEKQIERLLRVAQGFVEYEPSDTFYRDFWSVTSQIFNDSQAGSAPKEAKIERAYRLSRLHKARQKIPRKHETTRRLCLIFFAHDVEHISQQEEIKTSKGLGKISGAIKEVAEALSETPEQEKSILKSVKSDCRRSRRYMDFIEQLGPSSLLKIGDNVSYIWEKHITRADIPHLVQYGEQQRRLQRWDMSSDLGVTYMFLIGLMEYGWSLEGLLRSDTRLMKVVKRYLCCALRMFNVELALELSVHEGSLFSHCSRCRRKKLRDDRQEDSDSPNKRRHVDGSEESGRFSPGRNDLDPAAPSQTTPPDTRSYEEFDEGGGGQSNFSQLDALTAVAIAAAQAGLDKDDVAHMDLLSPNQLYPHHSLIHPGGSSSMVGGMVNYRGTATIATLSTAVNNTSQGGLDARISLGRDSDSHICEGFGPGPPLHLWTADDVSGRGYEELMFMDPLEFSLWNGQDLVNRPFELLESDFYLGDGQTS